MESNEENFAKSAQIQRLRSALTTAKRSLVKDTNEDGGGTAPAELSSTLSSSSSSGFATPVVDPALVFERDLKQMKEVVKQLMDCGDLREMDADSNASKLKSIGHIENTFGDYDHGHRVKLAFVLHEMNFAGWLCKAAEYVMGKLNFAPKAGFVCSHFIATMTMKALNVLWNYADVSRPFVKDLTEAGLVKLMADTIACKDYLDNQSNGGVHYIVLACINILHNLAKGGDDTKDFADANVKDLLKPFLEAEDIELRAISTMTLSAIISEEENSLLEDTGVIPFIVGRLKKAVASEDRRYDGFATTELAEALGRVAVNDTNKATIVEQTSLPLLVDMLKQLDEQEQLAAIKTLWTLAFDDDIRQKIHKEEGCMEALEKLTKNEKDNVKNAASGSLWVINGNHKKAPTPAPAGQKQHVFISYSWANQPEVIEIKDRLKADGFRVWFDKEQMGGSTMDAMAEAVENAAVVLICMSEQYKARPKTRTEAEYTFEQNKPFVPLMMQRYYKPDGWLGLLLGSKFYVNFDGKYEFEEAYGMLLKELKGRGKEDAPPHSMAQAMDVVDFGAAPTTFSQPPPPPRPSMADWSQEKVHKWLDDSGLEGIKDKLPKCDGKLLNRLNAIRKESPDFFYNYIVKEQLKLDTMDVLRLVEALASVRL